MGAPQVLIVGGGLAGVSASAALRRAGCEVQLIEREARAGGRAAGGEREGFRLDAAPFLVSSREQRLLDLIGAASLTERLLPLRPVALVHARGGRLDPAPPAGRRLEVARVGGVRLREALRLHRLARLERRFADLLDPEAPERAVRLDDRSAADFVRLYFGPSVLERWAEPILGSTCWRTRRRRAAPRSCSPAARAARRRPRRCAARRRRSPTPCCATRTRSASKRARSSARARSSRSTPARASAARTPSCSRCRRRRPCASPRPLWRRPNARVSNRCVRSPPSSCTSRSTARRRARRRACACRASRACRSPRSRWSPAGATRRRPPARRSSRSSPRPAGAPPISRRTTP